MKGLQKVTAIRPRLADFVYDQIINALQTGQIGPEDHLHQVKLADMLAVSRTPVREALLRLEHEGLLKSSANGGFELRTVTEKEVREIYQMRQAIEGFAAGLLAQENDIEKISALRDVIGALEESAPKDNAAYYEANRKIHRSFVEATDNTFLLEGFDSIWNKSISIQVFQTLREPELQISLHGHLLLCDKLKSADFKTAQSAMHEHIADGCKLQVRAM
ncbi:GntR family transcriptional regulator [Rhodobacteraceae bacterium F11138]|nr:GntR family transcriptional regulator [Rhodobacteraceae bacterium F11138]